MPLSKGRDSHCEKRFHIECPVTVVVRARSSISRELQGTLRDIGEGGARFHLGEPVSEGTRLILYVHFPNPNKTITTMRFEGIVTQSSYEVQHTIVMEFRGGGKFLSKRLGTLPVNGPVVQDQAASKAS